ncbi:transcription elongation factor GreA [Candidatus Dependentiae bacterium]|nr:transcription elongation factor GreA [Candidatus Dependentiae bacterium]
MRELLISQETYDKLKKELNELVEEKPKVQELIAEAREHGDLSENAEYHAARERYAFIEARISQIGTKLANSKIVDPKKIKSNKVGYGVTVKLLNKNTKKIDEFTVVGDGEADPDRSEISMNSPIGRSILDKKEGDDVDVSLPMGVVKYKIKQIYIK